MKIPLANKSDPGRSTVGTSERLINMFAESLGEHAKSKFALYRAPGLRSFSNPSGSVSRGLFMPSETELLALQGTTLWSIDEDGDPTSIGTILGSDKAFFSVNAAATPQTTIVVEGTWYVLEGGVLDDEPDADLFPDPLGCLFMDGYTIFWFADGRFQWSALNDSTDISALDFATAEGDPDGLLRISKLRRELLMAGPKSTEVWVNTGGDNVFERLGGAPLPYGIIGKHAGTNVAGKHYFVDGDGVVRRLSEGYSATRISTVQVENLIADLDDPSEIEMWGYVAGGHEFVVVQTDSFSWVYDGVTGVAHERKSLARPGWNIRHYAKGFGKNLVGMRNSGKILELTDEEYDEDGEPLVWDIILPPVDQFPMGGVVDRLDVDIEPGTAADANAEADAQDPEITLYTSKDGGKTWGTGRSKTIGTRGQYRKRVGFNRLGQFGREGLSIRLTGSAAVPNAILGADLDAKPRAIG